MEGFKSKIAGWQKSYMERLCEEYISLLESDLASSERFWNLEKRIRMDKKKAGVVVEMSRSKVFWHLISLLQDGAITEADLSDFSRDLQDNVHTYMEIASRYQ